jgi:GntR family transcriptional regulator
MTKICLLTRPLYLQARDLLAQRIAEGVWKPGSMLPNEQDLARELAVSPGTVRKALDQLEEERLLVRRQGRGTFVIDQASGDLVIRFSNIRDEAGQRIAGDLQMLDQSTGRASDVEQKQLQISEDQEVLRTRRTRQCKGHTFMYEGASLPVGRFPGLDVGSAGNYRLSALAQRHGLQLARAQERVSVAKASAEAANLLSLKLAAPVLRLDRLTMATDGRPVEWRVAECHLENAIYLAEMK